MNPRSAINKGKRLENAICHEIEEMGLGAARRESGSGSGKNKGDIFANLPFLIEAKNQKKMNWWKDIDQAKHQAEIGNWNHDKWALVVNDPRTAEFEHLYCVIDFWEFLKLLKKDKEPIIKEPDRALKWELEKLKTICQRIISNLQ